MAEGLDIGSLSGRVELRDDMSGVLEILGHKIDALDEKFGGFGHHVAESAAGFFTAEAALEGIKKVAELAVETFKELTIEGAVIADVEGNFDHLTEAAGRLGETLLDAVREGTHNTINDFQIMKLANQDLAAGMNLTDEQFKTLSKGAFALAQATGVDVKQALDTMNDAMLTGRTRAIALQFGKIDLAAAEERYADKLSTTSDRLTADEKLESARVAILEKVGAAIERIGDQTDGLDEKVAQAQTVWANFKEELAKTVATSPVIIAGFDGIRDAISEAFGGSQEKAVRTVANAIDDATIEALSFAEVVVDSVGVVGVEWNAAKVVFKDIAQIIDGDILAFKLASKAVAEFLEILHIPGATEDVKRIDDELANLEQRMMERAASIAKDKQAEEDWAVATGKVKDQIEAIRLKMVDAKASIDQNTDATAENAKQHHDAGDATEGHANAEAHLGNNLRLSTSELKAYNEAWRDLSITGSTYKDTLAGMEPEQIATIKYYLDAGVAVDKLAAAFPNLTKAEIDAVNQMKKASEEQIKAVDALSAAWNAMYQEQAAIGATDLQKFKIKEEAKYEALVQKLSDAGVVEEKYYDDVWALYKADEKNYEDAEVAKDTRSKAHLEQQLEQAQETFDRMIAHRDQYKQADIEAAREEIEHLKMMRDTWGEVGFSIDKDTEKVRTLAGEVLTLKEYEARQLSGGSMSYDLTTAEGVKKFHEMNPSAYVGASDQQLMAMAKKGMTLQQMIEQGIIDLYAGFKNGGSGGPIPSFANGGSGDFGSGTLAMLHGKEIITPIGNTGVAGPGGGGIQITNHINGTAADVARQVADEIMRTLKMHQQFGAR
jgi:hypothetical protein